MWRAVASGDWRQPPLVVRADETAVAPDGAPLVASLTASKRSRSYQFGFKIEGKGGETYSARSVTRDGKSVPEPRVQIQDESGEVVATGKFEYG